MSRDDRSQYQLSAMHAAEQPATSGDRLQQPATSGCRLQQPATSGCRLQPTSNQPEPPQTNQSCLMMPIYRYDQPSHPNTIPTESSEYNTNRVIRIPYQPSHPYTIPTESSVYHTNRVIRIQYLLQYTSPRTPPGARLTRQSTIYIYSIHVYKLRGDTRTVGTKSSISHSNAIQKLIRCEKRARARRKYEYRHMNIKPSTLGEKNCWQILLSGATLQGRDQAANLGSRGGTKPQTTLQGRDQAANLGRRGRTGVFSPNLVSLFR